MKKLLTICLVMMFGFLPHRAHAQVVVTAPIACQLGLCGAAPMSMSLASNVGGMLAAFGAVWVFPYLNTTGEKPFEEMFSQVDYSYPQSHEVQRVNVVQAIPLNDHKPYHLMTQWGDSIRSD